MSIIWGSKETASSIVGDLINMLTQPALVVDRDGRVVSVSTGWQSWAGCEADLGAVTWAQLFEEPSPNQMLRLATDAAVGGGWSGLCRSPSGEALVQMTQCGRSRALVTITPALASEAPVLAASSRSAGGFSSDGAVDEDREHLQLEINKMRGQLRRGDEDLRAILDLLPVGIALTQDPACENVRVNRAMSQMLGTSLEEAARAFSATPDESARTVRQEGAPLPFERLPLVRAARDGETVVDEELEVHLPDGRVQRWLAFAAPLRSGGAIRGAVGAYVDISERSRSQEDLERAKLHTEESLRAAEQANRAKDRFLAMLSHELRTPLTPVLATISELQQQLGSAATIASGETGSTDRDGEPLLTVGRLRDAVDLIRRNVDLEIRLIDDLLDLTRIARGKLKLVREKFDMNAAVADVVAMVRDMARAKGLELSLNLEATQSHVFGDPARLRQVIWNLLTNAIKFTPVGGKVRVTTSNPHAMWLRVEVTDTGIGIERDQIPTLFLAFEQSEVKNISRYGGLGLGLTISKGLVDSHAGRLIVRSDGPGMGASFAVELDAVEPETLQQVRDDAPGLPTGRPLHILLVDDHVDTCRAMRRLLRRMGFEVTTAHSVSEALGRANDGQMFDLLISDIGLPDGSGLDLPTAVRRAQAKHHEDVSTEQGVPATRLPAIALSGFGMDDDIRRSRDAGFNEHMTKPITLQKLRNAIDRLAR